MELLCVGCDQQPFLRWTDTHGIAVCFCCGVPYRVYHYEGDTRLNKGPEPIADGVMLEMGRDYFKQTGQPMFPGSYCVGSFHGGGFYSGHTIQQAEEFKAWADKDPRWIAEKARRESEDATEEVVHG